MAKVKAAVIEAQEFAQENYGMGRNEFVAHAWTFAKGNNLIHRAAIEEYDVIREDLAEYQLYYVKGENDAR